jgi:hypothetical protein
MLAGKFSNFGELILSDSNNLPGISSVIRVTFPELGCRNDACVFFETAGAKKDLLGRTFFFPHCLFLFLRRV